MTTTVATSLTADLLPTRRQPLRLAPAYTPVATPQLEPVTPVSAPGSSVPVAAPGLPVAAVRLPGRRFDEFRRALRTAGFGVLDILTQDVGPVPSVLVLELPQDEEALARLLAVARPGVGRVLITRDRGLLAEQTLRPGLDEIVDAPAHPLHVTVAALRVSGSSDYRLAKWSESAFEDVSFP